MFQNNQMLENAFRHLEPAILALLLSLGIFSCLLFVWRLWIVSVSGGNFEGWKKRLLEQIGTASPLHPPVNPREEKTISGRIVKTASANTHLSVDALEILLKILSSEERRRLERGIPFLGTVGNNAPFLGLTGTVIGILTAFGKLGMSGGRGNAEVMLAISNALVATAAGLAVAIPAVIFYNVLRTKVRKTLEKSRELSDLLLIFALQPHPIPHAPER